MITRTPLRRDVLRVVGPTVAVGCLAAGALVACGARVTIESTSDAGASDAGASDAGASDAGASDAGAFDEGTFDADASEAATADAGALGTSITGSIGGRSLSFTSATAWIEPNSPVDGAIVVFLSDAEMTCDTAAVPIQGSTRIDFYVYDFGSGVPPGAGTYHVAAGNTDGGGIFASAWPHLYGDQCAEVTPQTDVQATSGTFIITSTSPRIEGSFDVTFADGNAAGTFSVPACPEDGGTSTASCL
jgi:hypothetical protein